VNRAKAEHFPLSAEVNKEWNYGPTSTLPIYLHGVYRNNFTIYLI